MLVEVLLETFLILLGFAPHLAIGHLEEEHAVAILVDEVAVIGVFGGKRFALGIVNGIVEGLAGALLKQCALVGNRALRLLRQVVSYLRQRYFLAVDSSHGEVAGEEIGYESRVERAYGLYLLLGGCEVLLVD